MTDEECFTCNATAETSKGLIPVITEAENKQKREYDEKGRIKATYETKERYYCLSCIGGLK